MKHIDSLKQIQTLLSNQGSQAQLLNFSSLKIEIKNENIKRDDLFTLLQRVFPNVKELILLFDKTELKNDFLSKFQIFLEQNTQIEQIYIQLYRNKFQIRQAQAFILFVRNKFNNSKAIDYVYKYNNIAISCGICQISFENDFKSSIWLKNLKQNTYSINIKQNQQHLIEILYKYIKIDISDIKVELFHKNKLYVSLSNGNQQAIILKLEFDELDDLQQFEIHEHQIAEINIPIKDLQILGFNKCFLLQQIKKRHNFSFKIQESVTILSFKEENIQISNRGYIQESLKKYDLSNSNKMNLNTKFKIQFYKDFILGNKAKINSLNGYDINLYLVQYNHRELITKIQYNLTQKNERQRFEIDLESISDVIEIIQQYVYELQKVEENQNIKLKLIEYKFSYDEMKKNLFDEVAKINFMKTKIQKLSLNFFDCSSIKECPFISKIYYLQNVSLKIKNQYALFEFLQKNRGYFRKLHNLINLDVQFYYMMRHNDFNEGYILFLKNNKIETIYKDYDRIYNLNIYHIENKKCEITKFFQKFKRLSQIQCFYNIKMNCKNKYYYEYDYYYDDEYSLSIRKFEKAYEQKGKTHFAYLLIENHDDNQCSYTRKEFCTCLNNKMQKLLKQPSQFFANRIVFNEDYQILYND
ncbi:hypothetical protein ABPG74_000422 [Tetrahymena malaccensis]